MQRIGAGHMSTKKDTKNNKKSSTKKKKKNISNLDSATRFKLINELTSGIEDIAEVTITIPLSNITKKLHTRMFIKTKLSLPELQNMKELGQIFKANAYYYNDKYVKNVWFIKKIKINVSNSKEEMTLTLLPFNDSYESEANTLSGLTQQKNKTSSSTSTASSTSDVTLSKILSGDEQEYLEDIVKKAIGTKTDKEAQALAIYKYYQDNHVYQLYCCMTSSSFKTLWNKRGHNCGDGARTLAYMFKCIGLEPHIMNGHHHFWIQVEINGKTYYCDQAGAEGTHNMCTNGKSRVMSTGTGHCVVYGGATGGSMYDWNYGCEGPGC